MPAAEMTAPARNVSAVRAEGLVEWPCGPGRTPGLRQMQTIDVLRAQVKARGTLRGSAPAYHLHADRPRRAATTSATSSFCSPRAIPSATTCTPTRAPI